jgi:anti-sigma B factor antagonist
MPSSGLVVAEVKGVMVVAFQSASITDLLTIETIGGQLYALVEQQARKKIVLDFTAVRFLSSQMLGVLIQLQRKARQIGGRIVLCSMRPDLMKVFEITRLDKILEFAPDERQALAKLDVLGVA